MRDGIQGLGWFVRRTEQPLNLTAFYRDALGLVELRRWEVEGEEGAMLYAGDVGVFEINTIGKGGARPLGSETPETAPCTPVFRVHGAGSVADRLTAAGATIERDDRDAAEGFTKTLWLKDIGGHLMGLREADPDSGLTSDSLAADAWSTRETDAPPFGLPANGVQDIAAVRLTVPDVPETARFYMDAVGLDLLTETKDGGAILYLGSTAVLELTKGKEAPNPPEDRTMAADAFVLRTYDYIGLRASMASHGAKVINTLERAGGNMDMVLDPAGHLFGFQERIPPDPEIPTSNLVEDVYARERWTDTEMPV